MLASTLLILAVVATVQDDGENWETVAFKEGGFVVEMPALSEQEGTTPFSSPYGRGTLIDRLRQGNGVIYDVKQYLSPQPIAAGDVGRWLDFGRTKETGFAHGKLVSEKKIQVGSVAGREYVFRDDQGFDTRGRAFVKGSTLVVLLASSSMGNKPLPPKADRFLESFAFGARPSAAGKKAAQEGEAAEDKRKASAPWKVVALVPDKATVEMPGETAKTMGGNMDGPLSEFFCLSTNAEGAGVDYSSLVFKGEHGLAAANEAKALKIAIERAVTNFGSNGKVVSEQMVQSRAGQGREYTMTIERRGGVTVQARCRAYVDGGIILMLMAASKAKGKDLPPECARFFDSFVIKGRGGDVMVGGGPPGGNGPPALAMMGPALKGILGSGNATLLMGAVRFVGSLSARPRPGAPMANSKPPEVVMPAPAPSEAKPAPTSPKPAPVAKANTARPKANPFKAWGTEVDPDGDVELRATARSLTMEIPGTPHVLAPERDKMNAPRVVAPTRGDFSVVVRVDGAFSPSDKSTVKGLSSRQAGGLILWKDSGNYLVFQRRASAGDEGREANQAVLEELVAGRKGVTHRQAAQEGPVYLRLDRKRGRIAAAYSVDGGQWKELKPVDTTWAEGELQVGVIAVNTSTGPHEVTFEGYSLKPR